MGMEIKFSCLFYLYQHTKNILYQHLRYQQPTNLNTNKIITTHENDSNNAFFELLGLLLSLQK